MSGARQSSCRRANLLRCRVAHGGSLPAVQTTPSLPEQFGLHCAVVRRLTRGFPWKVCSSLEKLSPNHWRQSACCTFEQLAVAWCPLLALECDQSGAPVQVVAHRAYLRTNTGNHRVVTARTAARYFGPAPPGERSPRCASHQQVSIALCKLDTMRRRMSKCLFVRPLVRCVTTVSLSDMRHSCQPQLG